MDLFVFCVVILMLGGAGILSISALAGVCSRHDDERASLLGSIGCALFAGAILVCIVYTGTPIGSGEVFVGPGIFGTAALVLFGMWHSERKTRLIAERQNG
jgi:hypothetical protein